MPYVRRHKCKNIRAQLITGIWPPPPQDEICWWYFILHPNYPPWSTETHTISDGTDDGGIICKLDLGRFSSSSRSNNCTVLLLVICTTDPRDPSCATHEPMSCATCPIHCATDLLSHALTCTTHFVL